MNPAKQREALSKVYSNEEWQTKVAAMTDAQVVAIYLRLKAQNKV